MGALASTERRPGERDFLALCGLPPYLENESRPGPAPVRVCPFSHTVAALGVIDILIFGLIAAFLVYRLRSVLGRRTGHERQRPNPFATPERPAERTDTVIALPDRRAPADNTAPTPETTAPVSTRAGLTQVKLADPSFNEGEFLQGARIAFGMIVEAFAKGDTETLRPLLSNELNEQFGSAIRERLTRSERMETTVEGVPEAEIVAARVDGRTAFVTVRFVSRQVNVVRNEQGQPVNEQGLPLEDDGLKVTEVTDLWTFARNTRANNPNWVLVETSTPG